MTLWGPKHSLRTGALGRGAEARSYSDEDRVSGREEKREEREGWAENGGSS